MRKVKRYASDSEKTVILDENEKITAVKKGTNQKNLETISTATFQGFFEFSGENTVAGAPGIEPGSGVLETLILPMNYAPKMLIAFPKRL